MRKLLKAALVVAMAVPGLASAATIVGSLHDLSEGSGSGAAGLYNSSEKQICKFCHTPHNAIVTEMALWNRDPGVAQSFNWAAQGGKTNYGTELPSNIALGAPTMRCMSCHDGVTALGATRAGELGAMVDTDGNAAVIRYSGKIGVTDTDGNVDLSGNHPVTVTYPNEAGGQYLSRPVSQRFTDEPLLIAEDFVPFDAVVGAKVYGAADGLPGVECGSCHEPHGVTDTDGNDVGQFLRMSNDASALCRACHLK